MPNDSVTNLLMWPALALNSRCRIETGASGWSDRKLNSNRSSLPHNSVGQRACRRHGERVYLYHFGKKDIPLASSASQTSVDQRLARTADVRRNQKPPDIDQTHDSERYHPLRTITPKELGIQDESFLQQG